MQTYGQLKTTLAQMCPDPSAGPADGMEQMTWLGMSEYFIQGSGGCSDSKEDYSWQCSATISPPQVVITFFFFTSQTIFYFSMCFLCLYISLHMALYIPVYNMFMALV